MDIEPALFFRPNKPVEPLGISLTEAALSHIRHQLDDRSGYGMDETKGIGIRFGVTGAGCGGFSYTVEFVDTDTGMDHIFEQDGVKIFVDKKSIIMIDGMEVDYVTDGFSSGLAFHNPLAGQTCGCGESFTIN
jgi:iron-sulfur cluster assembly protein